MVSIFHKLEPLVKVRLLIACALAPEGDRAKHSAELQHLAEHACKDDDEWVSAQGRGDLLAPLPPPASAAGRGHMRRSGPRRATLVRARRAAAAAAGARDGQRRGRLLGLPRLGLCAVELAAGGRPVRCVRGNMVR